MTEKENNLSKMLIVYQWLYMTEQPTAAVTAGIKKFQAVFRPLMKKHEKMWLKCRTHQKDLYAKAWENTEEESDGRTLSVGLMVTKLYQSIPQKEANKYIGKKAMERVTDSYFFAEIHDKDRVEIEKHANILVDEIIRLYDGEKAKSPLADKVRRLKAIKALKEKDKLLEG